MSHDKVTNEDLEWIGDLAVEVLKNRALPEGVGAKVPDEVVQQLLTVAVKLYMAKLDSGEAESLGPFIGHVITDTDAAETATQMLDALGVDMLEYALWKSLGRPDD